MDVYLTALVRVSIDRGSYHREQKVIIVRLFEHLNVFSEMIEVTFSNFMSSLDVAEQCHTLFLSYRHSLLPECVRK